MKVLKFISLLLIFTSLNAKDINYGLVTNFTFSTAKEARLSLKIWAKEVKKYADLDIKIIIYDDEKDLINDYILGKIQIATFPALAYLKYKKDILKHSRQLFTFSLSDSHNLFIQYYLLKNKKSKINLNDLLEKNIYFKEAETSAKIWLDYIMLKKYNKSYKEIFTNEFELKKQSAIVYKVFFKELNYAIVPKVIYETIIEINPQISKKVEIIEKSNNIYISLLGMINNNLDKEIFDKLIDYTLEKEYENIRKEAFSISSIKSFIKLNKDDLNAYEKIVKEYYSLKKKQ